MGAAGTTEDFRLFLKSRLPELDRLSAWVHETAQRIGLNGELAFALQLCLEEAVANIIMHGGSSEDTAIKIDISAADDGMTAVIEDDARPFDPTSLPPRVKPRSLDEAPIGELGVHLLRNYASSLNYERAGDLNRLTLTFARLRPAEV